MRLPFQYSSLGSVPTELFRVFFLPTKQTLPIPGLFHIFGVVFYPPPPHENNRQVDLDSCSFDPIPIWQRVSRLICCLATESHWLELMKPGRGDGNPSQAAVKIQKKKFNRQLEKKNGGRARGHPPPTRPLALGSGSLLLFQHNSSQGSVDFVFVLPYLIHWDRTLFQKGLFFPNCLIVI